MAAKKKRKKVRAKARPRPKAKTRKPKARPKARPKPKARKPKARPKARPKERKPKSRPKARPRKPSASAKRLIIAEFKRHSEASRLGWGRRKLREEREEFAPNEGASPRRGLTEEKRLQNLNTLRRMIDEEHFAWLKWLERGRKLGLDMHEIKNQWISPKVKKR